jgi:hypothetical protein
VGSPHEAEYHALIRGLKLAAEKRLPYVAAFVERARRISDCHCARINSPSGVSSTKCEASPSR